MLSTLAVFSAAAAALPASSVRLAPRAACTPEAGGSASTDDVPAITSALTKCGNGGTIVLPAGTTYYANSVLDFEGCKGCDFQIEGTLKFSDDTDFWNGERAMINVKKIDGAKIRSLTGSGVIDGNGQAAWDLFAKDKDFARPTLVYISGSNDITLTNIAHKDAPNVFISARDDSKNVHFSDLSLSAKSTSDNEPKNTDGFDIGAASYVTVSNVTVVNDDDCIAFKPGADFVTVTDVTCTGSHGISVGSLGKGSPDTVTNVYAGHITMIDSTKAAGIKTYPTDNGHQTSTVSNVTFEDFTVKNCDYAFQIQSCYGEDDEYCESSPGDAKLSGVVVKGFTGTTSDKEDPVTANLNCGEEGTCGVSFSGWEVKAPSGKNEVLCANTPSDLGVECTEGASG
ncbi:glycoside hydrolase family 28 protein [Aplosporella prunicola CBS 121167]|uniref:Glycoside hydrolase family 28 protein n=1 Tax=Aplosporella prunicola CBS 121167 TaxID=1176127 RepID=A0A6A6B0Q2_9PEZI|nr:glycoside hydrolase family 28 protein [Aplosporella prunicola CBS 121167]KAF2136825.1 glycoside hydrolase family 28 protein [Aplosporella prunicola CBS 121167]